MATARVTTSFRRLALVLCLTGCHTWRPVELAPARAFGANTRVRVERSDGSILVLHGPRIVGDSAVAGQDGAPGRPAVALTDVRRAEEYRVSRTRTALVAVGLAAGIAFWVVAVQAHITPID